MPQILPPPAPQLAPAELAHFHSLQASYAAILAATEDPQTPIAARELMQSRLDTVYGEIETMNAIAYGRTTVDLKAEAAELRPAVAELKALQTQLAAYATTTAHLQAVASALDTVLATAEALGI